RERVVGGEIDFLTEIGIRACCPDVHQLGGSAFPVVVGRVAAGAGENGLGAAGGGAGTLDQSPVIVFVGILGKQSQLGRNRVVPAGSVVVGNILQDPVEEIGAGGRSRTGKEVQRCGAVGA